jgi:hypothetical protein
MDARSKKERREAGRRERERILKQIARRKRIRSISIASAIVLAVAAVSALAILKPGSSADHAASPVLPGLQAGPPPWPPELSHLRQRLRLLHLPASSSMAANLHHHDLLQIFVHGKPVTVPASIGINPTAGFLTSIHTHDDSGIIHVESPTIRKFTLGQVFDVWGVRFTPTCLGGLCNDGANALRVFVDGKPYSGDPRAIPLTQHEDIVVTYGTEQELPHPIPSTYSKSISPTCAPSC